MGLPATVLLCLSFAVYSSGFQPTGYHLKIDVSNLTTSQTYNGTVHINLTASTEPIFILLNAVDMNVSSVNMIKLPNKDVNITSAAINDGKLKIIFEKSLSNRDFLLTIAFEGRYSNAMTGFSKVSYSYNNTLSYLGVTNFEPNYTGYVFPCPDEPNPHVNIKLDVTTLNQAVLSGVPYDSIDTMGSKLVYKFTSYPKMPVSQLGWIVMDNNTFEVLSDNTTQIPVFTRALYKNKNHTNWATALTVRLLEEVVSYTSQNYPLPKLEQFVVPDYFVGTVQSLGLISYSEEAFLVDVTATSTKDKHQVALGVAQNVLKQWFGDLVTMDSQEDSWLMNGFTEHLKYSICDSIPTMLSWELTKHEVVDLIQPALAMSPLRETTSLSSLNKYRGGALIRMLQDFVGCDIFKKAVVSYISRMKDSDNNKPTELWGELYDEAEDSVNLDGKTISVIMQRWTETPGYPILNVTLNGTNFVISQSSPGWFVPVTYLLQTQSSGNPNRRWLNDTYNLTIPAKGNKWILLNLNQTGYYRVNYDQAVLKELKTDFGKLPTISRSQLVDDMFSLAIADGKILQLMEFLSVLKGEIDYYPWSSALRNFQILIDKFYGHTAYDQFKSFMLNQMTTVIDNVGMSKRDQDSHTDILKRVLILEKACAFGHKECLQKAVSIFKSWKAGTFFDADLNMALMCSAVANSSDDTWRDLLSNKNVSGVSSVKSSIVKALTCTKNVQLLKEFLTNITSTTQFILNAKEKIVFLKTLASTPFGANVLFNWLLDKLNTQIGNETTTVTPFTTTFEPTPNSTNSPTNVSSERSYRSVPMAENITEEDIELILFLIRPKLTSSDQIDKLDNFVATKRSSGLSNSTLDLIEMTRMQVYNQYQWAINYNANISKWLQTTSTTPGGASSGSTTATTATDTHSTITPNTTGKPSSASSFYSSLALTTLVVASHYFIPHFL